MLIVSMIRVSITLKVDSSPLYVHMFMYMPCSLTHGCLRRLPREWLVPPEKRSSRYAGESRGFWGPPNLLPFHHFKMLYQWPSAHKFSSFPISNTWMCWRCNPYHCLGFLASCVSHACVASAVLLALETVVSLTGYIVTAMRLRLLYGGRGNKRYVVHVQATYIVTAMRLHLLYGDRGNKHVVHAQ